jgi:hypothetical protein
MKVLDHPTFECDYSDYERTLGTHMFFKVFFGLILFVACYVYSLMSIPLFLVFWVSAFFLIKSNQKNLKNFIENQICPSCGYPTKLISFKKIDRNYLSECMRCQIRWDLNLSIKTAFFKHDN